MRFTSAGDTSGDGGKYVLHKSVLVWLKTRLAAHWIIKWDKQKLDKENYCDVILCGAFFPFIVPSLASVYVAVF